LTATEKVWNWIGTNNLVFCSTYNALILFQNLISIEPCYLSMQITFTDELFALYIILEWLSFIILIHITDILVQCVNMSYISCVLVKGYHIGISRKQWYIYCSKHKQYKDTHFGVTLVQLIIQMTIYSILWQL
jgi:hypothetical protein